MINAEQGEYKSLTLLEISLFSHICVVSPFLADQCLVISASLSSSYRGWC